MLFFIISAFTLCLSMNSRSDEQTPLRNYFLRRFFRIAPLFYVWMALYYVRDIVVFGVHQSAGTVAQSLFFVLNFFPGREQGYVWASWTIGVEMLFYVIFPLIFFIARNVTLSVVLLAVGFALRHPWHMLLRHAIPTASVEEAYYQSSLIYHLPEFLMGVVLFHLYRKFHRQAIVGSLAGYVPIILCCALMGWLGYKAGAVVSHTQAVTLAAVAYSLLVVGLCIRPSRIFVNRITRFYGSISYSVYLSHATTLYFMSNIFRRIYEHESNRTLAFAACFLAGLAIITPISYLTYRFIERPGNAFGRTLIKRWSKPRDAASLSNA